MQGKESQKHGNIWQNDICQNVYGATTDELNKLSYTAEIDLPSKLNRLDNCDISVKTSGSLNLICMADALKFYERVNSEEQFRMVVIFYQQIGDRKKLIQIIEIDLTNSRKTLFGSLTKESIEELKKLIQEIPRNQKPTKEQRKSYLTLRTKLNSLSGAIMLNPKCDSKENRRLQCSFNKFQQFLNENQRLILHQSNSNEFRGGKIAAELESSPRRRKCKHCGEYGHKSNQCTEKNL